MDEVPSDDSDARLAFAVELLDHIPAVERIALALHLSGVCQVAIGLQLGMSHQAVSKRTRRALYRLRFLAHWPGTHVPQAELRAALAQHFDHPTVVVLVAVMRSTSLAGARRQLGATHRFVHYHYRRGLRRLRALARQHAELEAYRLIFDDLHKNLGVLHEQRPRHLKGAA